jgi:uncharacterized protein YjbJ (UPF0337 family)
VNKDKPEDKAKDIGRKIQEEGDKNIGNKPPQPAGMKDQAPDKSKEHVGTPKGTPGESREKR